MVKLACSLLNLYSYLNTDFWWTLDGELKKPSIDGPASLICNISSENSEFHGNHSLRGPAVDQSTTRKYSRNQSVIGLSIGRLKNLT